MNTIDGVARVLSRRAMLWEAPVDPAEDRTEHVRAASGVVWLGDRLAVIQDDTSFLALVSPTTARAQSLALTPGPARRFEEALGNKADKLDLESCVSWVDDRGAHLVAFGSGSTKKRERIVHIHNQVVHLLDAAPMYDALRGLRAFAGDELNVEGAVLVGERLRLFQRGNGAAGLPARRVVDATVELVRAGDLWVPLSETARAYDLGTLDGVRLTFTDATAHHGVVWFLATAEDSPNSVDDGPVVGSVIGRFAPDGSVATLLRLVDDAGPLVAKTEGIVFDRVPGRAWVVVDRDDTSIPAELLYVDLAAHSG